jgi:serine/threonine-protein kinase RsbW
MNFELAPDQTMEPSDWVWQLDERIPSNLQAGHSLLERLSTALLSAGWEGRDLFHVQLATEEALVNAITHGNQLDESKQVEVSWRLSRRRFWSRFTDEGSGFDPSQLPDPTDECNLEQPHGRGVMLIQQLMSSVVYSERGNQVTMIKDRAAN